MPATAIRTTRLTGTTVDKVPISKNLGGVFSESEASLKEIAELEELKKLVAECQKVGSELYDEGLIKPYDPRII